MRHRGAIFVGDVTTSRLNVGSIYVEASGDLTYSSAHFCSRVIALVPIRFTDVDKQRSQAVNVAAQRLLSDVDLLLVRNEIEINWLLRELRVNSSKLAHPF